ncbi:hypothetical protein [Aquimarina aquimarini]|uniref:hypothetical protein n=1 Tax=Aquimarina aquimarini TaxID=1191734 RepID=UPI000D56243D|nr:hypothetical protein [Aquimarina aquimarini]
MKITRNISILLLSTIFLSCNNYIKQEAPTKIIYIDQKTESDNESPTIIGEWHLDSIIHIDNGITGSTQYPFATMVWAFSDKGTYTVTRQEDELELTPQSNDSLKSKFTAEVQKKVFNGKYQQKDNKLITFIFGGETNYHIKEKSDTLLLLESQRYQVPPISEEDKNKITRHYFTYIKK